MAEGDKPTIRDMTSPEVTLSSLCVSDLEFLHDWMNRPHLKPFYMQQAISADEIRRKFTPRIDTGHYCHCLIAGLDGHPFGYIQWYLNADVPDYGAGELGFLSGVSFDYFIGDSNYLGKQLGSKMLVAAISWVCGEVEKTDQVFYLIHANANTAAIRCSKGAGFSPVASLEYNGEASKVYMRAG